MSSDAANRWTEFYTKSTEMMYPAEAVIRIFKGTYPNLKMPKPKAGESILDIGFGDGRHIPLFHSLGMSFSGTEISESIISQAYANLGEEEGHAADLRVGTCANLPWPDATFDYEIAWNSCYYMGPDGKFEDHVAEMARVIKPGGWIVCSVPKMDCFIFKGAEPLGDGYVTIKDDYFGLRNGERMRCIRTRGEFMYELRDRFQNFNYASIDIDMFGLAYNWHVIVAQRT